MNGLCLGKRKISSLKGVKTTISLLGLADTGTVHSDTIHAYMMYSIICSTHIPAMHTIGLHCVQHIM